MNTPYTARLLSAAAALYLAVAPTHAAEPAGATASPPDAIAEAFSKGKVSLNVRGRYETVDQSNRNDANAFTFRTALGFTTAPYQGFTASVELEDVTALGGSKYAAAPNFSPNVQSRAVIADPVGTEVNQAWLAYKTGETTIKGGRFNLVVDNARFIGNVGWRQNAQTFDGLVVQGKPAKGVAFTYAYLDHINRIFGDDIAGGNWDSDSHVANVSYAGLPIGTLTGYTYLLDFDNAAAQSSATYGLSLVGAQPLSEKAKVTYRAEFAHQSDYGSSTLNYSTSYLLGEAGVSAGKISGALGYEELGTDNGQSFRTPLATLHAFNGWGDLFLTTPNTGLRDTYAKFGYTFPKGVALLAFYHQFKTDTGVDLGDEFDVQVSCKFNKYFSGLVKFADFSRDSTTVPNVQKLWVQFDFAY